MDICLQHTSPLDKISLNSAFPETLRALKKGKKKKKKKRKKETPIRFLNRGHIFPGIGIKYLSEQKTNTYALHTQQVSFSMLPGHSLQCAYICQIKLPSDSLNSEYTFYEWISKFLSQIENGSLRNHSKENAGPWQEIRQQLITASW